MNDANLKPWGPNNPPPRSPGRPKSRPLSSAYDDVLRSPLPERERIALKLAKGTTWAQAIALARARAALTRTGTLDAKEIGDRVEGRPMQRIELGGAPDGFEVRVTFDALPGKHEEKVIDVTPEQLPASEADKSGSAE